MSQRIVVDPITRIEGHLRIEAQMAGNTIEQAYSSGTMVRGIELILQGRDPRDAWAFTQRICGVCTLVHAMASIRAVEDALKYPIPPNAQLIRNLMIAAQYVHDHVMHFYHLHALDWVDVVSALKADPDQTAALAKAVGPYAKNSPTYFKEIQQRLLRFAEGGQLGIFGNAYWGHPEYKLPPEANLMAVAHYLEALTWQRDVVQIHTIFGGKNPHPNFVVGGVPCAIAVEGQNGGGASGTAVDMVGLMRVKEVIRVMGEFVDQAYLPDILAIAGFYPEWATVGEGVGNFLTYGDFPDPYAKDKLMIPRGVILNRDISTLHKLDLHDPEQIQEFVSHSWYDYAGGNDKGLHPYKGETKFRTAEADFKEQLNVDKGYSWLKSPRWRGKPVEVGPLARMLVLHASGHAQAQELVNATLGRLKLPVSALFSTLGRTAARALETKIIVDAMAGWFDQLMANIKRGELETFNNAKWDPGMWPSHAQGAGFTEAPRGALAHWVVIDDGKISNYQAVVPSTWNAGPRDPEGQPGPYEAALAGQRMVDPTKPLEILRTIHSFDPCIACAVHVLDPDGGEVTRVKVV
ncbi:MAG: nickel-dependent hydrogenase large subunit [Magnetococcales bacterium]|nr:nickel-dependent hydrogenase large subunit [Magnetococcales bacterium]